MQKWDDIAWIFLDMGSTLVDETAASREWFRRISAVIDGALSAQEIEDGYVKGKAENGPSSSELLRPYGFTGKSTTYLYPSELDEPYPEAAAVLAALAKRYKLGVIANQNAGAEERLARYGLRQFFDVVVTSDEAGVSKPEPGIFLMALAQAGCTAAQAVMVGDRLDNDIAPAKTLGFKTIRIWQGFCRGQTPRTPAEEPDAVVTSLRELLAVL